MGFLLSVTSVIITRQSIWPFQASDYKMLICAAAVCNAIGNLASNAALIMVTSTASFVIQAGQPLLTFIFYAVSARRNVISTTNIWSLLIIILGLSTLVSNEKVFTLESLIAAVISTTAFAARNVLLKTPGDEWCSAPQKFMFVSLLSTVFVAPAWFIKMALTQESSARWFILSGVTHSAYSLASFGFLEGVNPVTHSVVTVFIEAYRYSGITYFLDLWVSLSWSMLCSLFVIIVGLILYHPKERFFIKSKVIFVIFVVTLLLSKTKMNAKQSEISHNELDQEEYGLVSFDPNASECNRIFTAWVYEEPIPDFIVTNIEALAHQNPDMSVLVYCGSTQCIEAVNKRKTRNMAVKFAIISEIVKGVSSPPLQLWLERHPLNKVLAGRKFEDHLQDVLTVGALWIHGGFYVNPAVKLGSTLSGEYQNCMSAWISNETTLPVGFQSMLTVAFFPSKHPFIHKLTKLYGSHYPNNMEDAKLFQQDFLRMMWLENECRNTTDCPSTRTLSDISPVCSLNTSLATNHFGMLSLPSSHQSTPDVSFTAGILDFAGIQYLPFVDTFMESNKPACENQTTAFFNGWWRTALPDGVDPVMLSVCLENNSAPPEELISYLKNKEPIGCGDSDTLKFLMEKNIKSFLSGSLVLLIGNSNANVGQRGGIYITELDDKIFKLLPTFIQKRVVHIEWNVFIANNTLARLKAANQLIDKYRSAELVITQCFHCASACVAIGTPVIFIVTHSNYAQSFGLTSLFHTLDFIKVSKTKARSWLGNFPWHDIPPNPNVGMMMRLRATAWNVIRQNEALSNTARKLGLIPMSPPYILPNDRKLLFHMIFTTSSKNVLSTFKSLSLQSGAFNWRHWRSVESVFYHHPTAELIIHSNTLSQGTFDVLTEAGYSVKVRRYDLEGLLKGSPAEKFIAKLSVARRGRYWTYNEGDLLRMLVVYKWGGVYMDTDIILVQPLTSLLMNGAGRQDSSNGLINGAFLMFEKGHPFVKEVLETFVSNYEGSVWGWNGPDLITKVWHRLKKTHNKIADSVQIYKHTAFYMIPVSRIKPDCFETTSPKTVGRYMHILHTKAYGLHVNGKITGRLGVDERKLKKGTLCSYLFNAFCVLCDKTF